MINAGRHICALRRVLPGLVAILFCLAQTANAADARAHRFELPGGALDEALKQFSEQAGVSLVYDHRIVSGRIAPALSGTLTTHDALRALLGDSPLEYREIDSGALAIVERPVVVELMPELPPRKHVIDDDRARVDEIIVTASYRAPDASGVRLSYSLDAEALNLSGAQNIAEPIHELPTTVASISAANSQLLISASGLNLTDLRGLEPVRSLVLVNGRRFVRTSGGNGNVYGVDLNAIPTALIDRVEIINQGAGPTLGTDAVAGAVNIIMRDHIDGVSLTAHGGASERGDASEYSFSLFAGDAFADGRGKISGGVVYTADPSLFYSDRDYLSQPYGFALDGRQSFPGVGAYTPGFGGSVFTPAGSVAGAIDTNGDIALFVDPYTQYALTPGGFEPFEGRLDQLYNWLDGFSALPEIDRLHGYARVDYELTAAASFFGEFFFADVETTNQIAAAPLSFYRGADATIGDSLLVPADHPSAPAGLRAAVEAAVGGPIDSFLVNRRFVELGQRRHELNRQTVDFIAGVEIDLGNDWALNASYGYGRSRAKINTDGLVDATRAAIAIDPGLCAATPGCAPLDVFSGGPVSQATADYYGLPARMRRITTQEHVARATASGPIYQSGERQGLMSAGVEYRRDVLDDKGASSFSSAAAAPELDAPGSAGSVGYAEVFAGVDLPFSPNQEAFGVFELGVDGRATRWSGGGFVGNVSGDLSWTPIAGLELYAFALYGGRAPNIIELSSAGLNLARLYNDPCTAPVDPIIADNCASGGALGVPAGFSQQNALIHYSFTGNPNLDNEKVRTRHFGVAADIQEFVYLGDNALRATADWRYHRITNLMGGGGAIAELLECYDSPALSGLFCGVNPATGNLFLQRDAATGELTLIETTYLNAGELETSGLDATIAYRSELLWAPLAPALSVDVLYSYVDKISFRGVHDETPADILGLSEFPRHQVYATAGLETDRWKTLWTIRRRGATQAIDADIPEARLPAIAYVDAGLQFRPGDNVIVYAGVENLFDKAMPVAMFRDRGFFAEFYDPIGRRYFAGVKAEF